MKPTFAQRLRRARGRLGLSQAGAALRLGVSVRTLQNWEIERNTPDPFKQTAILERLTP